MPENYRPLSHNKYFFAPPPRICTVCCSSSLLLPNCVLICDACAKKKEKTKSKVTGNTQEVQRVKDNQPSLASDGCSCDITAVISVFTHQRRSESLFEMYFFICGQNQMEKKKREKYSNLRPKAIRLVSISLRELSLHGPYSSSDFDLLPTSSPRLNSDPAQTPLSWTPPCSWPA